MKSPNINTQTILLADGDVDLVNLLAGYLGRIGFEVFVAQNGREVVDIARQKKPDLIILEIVLPELDGLEACRQLRSDDLTQDIPIIFLSAKDNIDSRVGALSIGGDDFISKPFNPRELEARISVALRKKTS